MKSDEEPEAGMAIAAAEYFILNSRSSSAIYGGVDILLLAANALLVFSLRLMSRSTSFSNAGSFLNLGCSLISLNSDALSFQFARFRAGAVVVAAAGRVAAMKATPADAGLAFPALRLYCCFRFRASKL